MAIIMADPPRNKRGRPKWTTRGSRFFSEDDQRRVKASPGTWFIIEGAKSVTPSLKRLKEEGFKFTAHPFRDSEGELVYDANGKKVTHVYVQYDDTFVGRDQLEGIEFENDIEYE